MPFATAQSVLIENPGWDGFMTSTKGSFGQSFTTPDDGTNDILTGVKILINTTTYGSIYILDHEYLGEPYLVTNEDVMAGAVNSVAGKFLVSIEYTGPRYSEWDFTSNAITLNPGTQYWFYYSNPDDTIEYDIALGTTGLLLSPDYSYHGGDFYSSFDNSSSFVMSTNSDTIFAIYTTPIPEPQTYAFILGAISAGYIGIYRFKIRSRTKR